MIPKDLTRVTNHKTPRHQLYQPGFNNFNSCWLDGEWITVPADEFKKRAAEHKKLYAGLHKAAAKQSHRDKGTPISRMTPGQKQAWEFYSGEPTIDVRSPHDIGPARVKTAGKVVSAESLEWLKSRQMKVIPKVIQPDGKITDQTKMVPPDMLSDDTEPVNVWQLIVKHNKSRSREFAKGTAKGMEGASPEFNGFMRGVAVQHLLELEKQIMRMQIDPEPDLFETLDEVRAEYVEHRKEMKETLGENFQKVYDEAKATHNECARTNLDNSKGRLFSWVLPKFNDDGTHEPWGPRDFPWGNFKTPKTPVHSEASPA